MRILALAAPAFLCATAAAQHIVSYDPLPIGTGLMIEAQLPTRMIPGPVPPNPGYPIGPVLPPAAFGVVPAGDATHNGLLNQIWHTNGQLLAAMPAPNFPGAVPPPMPVFPIAPGVLAMLGGPVTGIAINPLANVMFLCSAPGMVIGVQPVPGTPVIVPPFAPAFVMGPVSGLDYDSITGSLFAVDGAGVVYNFAVGGAPLAPPILGAALPAVAGDVAIDKSGYVNPAGVRPIYVVSGPVILDVTFAAAVPQPSGGFLPTGCAFVARPASSMPGAMGCACGPLLPNFRANAPMTSGNGAFGLAIDSLPPFSPVLMAFDGAFNPAFPLINVSGCGLGLFLGSPTINTNFMLTNAGGAALWNLPLTFLPPGIGPIWAQAFYPCAADPAGFAITPTLQVSVCGH
jgi:hypothetical protein